MSNAPELPPPVAPRRWPEVLDRLLRVAGGVIAVAGAVVTGFVELIFAAVRVDGYLIGMSIPLAVLANLALSWFAYRAVGRRWAVALPAAAWFALMVVAAGGTSEGDFLLAGNNWVGIVMIFSGAVTFAAAAYRLMIPPRR
ncbi:hypothetical protein [Plantactinospora sp. KBS50]|uniref:hypothetical protein n=1 Tax=Plantactinospora sp. KBS50 TaxID=2024580 RepID=UPI000BAAED0A|nr:hypothetical protein [Plantactinospora sp. KBS50]ASW57975.1 hypothetical protein CIK06_24540 [Plantactinospora sp. KBS50]